MKSFIVFALFVAAAVAAPVGTEGDAEIIEQRVDNIGVDGYTYIYKTSNGIAAEETGALTNVGSEAEALEVRGGYSFVGDDGITYSVTYTAGKEGFKPEGAHLPSNP